RLEPTRRRRVNRDVAADGPDMDILQIGSCESVRVEARHNRQAGGEPLYMSWDVMRGAPSVRSCAELTTTGSEPRPRAVWTTSSSYAMESPVSRMISVPGSLTASAG